MRPHLDSRALAWGVLAAYLAVTAPAAVLSGVEAGGAFRWVMLAHLLALAAAFAITLRRRAAQTELDSARLPPLSAESWSRWLDWGPLVAMAILYGELPAVIAGAAGGSARVVYHDAIVQHWESHLFGVSPAIALALELPRWLSNPLHAAYLSYYALIFVPPLILFARRGRQREFETTILALTATFAACFVVFAYWPVEGPRYAWPPPPGVPDSTMREIVLRVLRSGSSRGAAFPSSHVAVATAQSIVALKYQKTTGIATAIVALLLAVGAVYGGFHYGVDVLVGATLGLLLSSAILASQRRAHPLLSMSKIPPRLQESPGE